MPAIAVQHDSSMASNDPELRVLLQPALCFPAFVDNVVVHDQCDGFPPTVCGFKPIPQADEQCRTFAVAAHIADFTCPAVQRSGQIIFIILSRRDRPFLLSGKLLVCTDFGIKMDIHVIFIKDRMLCCIFRHDRSLIRMEHRSVISIPFDHSRR